MSIQQIKEFKIHQFKGVRATVEIHPTGPGLVVIAGPNGSGKSSVVDGIMQLVAPAGVAGIPKPINTDAADAFVEMTTDAAIVRREYPKDGPGVLKVTATDGARYASGREFLVAATGGQIFDTAHFAALPEKDQRAELLRRVELPFDIDAIDLERRELFDTRTDTTREVKRLTAQLAGHADHDPTAPETETSVADLVAELAEIRAQNAMVDRLEERAGDLLAETVENARRVEAFEKHLAEARADLDKSREILVGAQVAADLAERMSTDDVDARLANVDQSNRATRANQARALAAETLAQITASEARLTARIKTIDQTKIEGLAAAVFPVDGLGIDETGITFQGIPFRQVNPARQIGVAFDLFTADDPDLRLIFIKNGDLLDDQSLAWIEEIAIARGYYVIVERDRDNSSELGWTMTDGALAQVTA